MEKTRSTTRSTSTSNKENSAIPDSGSKAGSPPGDAQYSLIMDELRSIKSDLQGFKNIQTKVTALFDEFKDFKTSITFFNTKMEDFEANLKKTMEKVKNIDVVQIKNSELEAKIMMLEAKMDDQERQQKNFDIEIRGVPEIEGENLQNILFNISKKINTTTTTNDIETSFRAPGRTIPTKTRPIIVRFKHVHLRNDFLNCTKKYNMNAVLKEDKLNTSSIGLSGPRTPVFISEHLTSTNKRLFYLAKKTATEKKLAYVWIKSGRVYIRQTPESRAILITSENTLLTL